MQVKMESQLKRVIMDLSWPHPLAVSVNGFTPKDTYLHDKTEDAPAHSEGPHLTHPDGGKVVLPLLL